MCEIEIDLGQDNSQAPVLVQLPNPTSSIFATIAFALLFASTLPCGSLANCETLAATKSIAEAFLHEATQAPHPMQAAASIASSASSWLIGIVFPSGTPPVLTEINPPACCIFSNAVLSTIKSLITGKAPALQGSTVIVTPSSNL